jgi:hypothetical protein
MIGINVLNFKSSDNLCLVSRYLVYVARPKKEALSALDYLVI